MLPDILETARLQLRPFRLQDVDDVLVYATDDEVWCGVLRTEWEAQRHRRDN